MRILMTTDTVGGVWTFTKELSLGLLDEGYSVALVSLGRTPDTDQQAWADRTTSGSGDRFQYYATTSPLEWMQENTCAFKHSAAFLERLAETFQADLIHSNQFCFGALATRIPVLITAHSDVLSWAQSCHPEALADTLWLTRYKALVQHGLYAAAGIAAPTPWMLDALRENFHLPAQTCILANGRTIDKPSNSSLNPGWDGGTHSPDGSLRKLQAVTAGRFWDQAKNLTLLTQIKSPIPLVLAGEAPLDPVMNVAFTGQLPEQALLTLFRHSAIYLCPSIYEPFGLAPMEAALCGCAVLANDIPPLRQVWGDAALYFSGASALEQLLNQLVANPDQLEAAQQRSHERAQGFSRGSMAASYIGCYRETLKAQKPAHVS